MAGDNGEDQEPKIIYTVAYLPEAEAEVLEAVQYYEDKAEGLGMEFARAVSACLSAIERFPGMYPVVYKQMRRSVLRRFPYNIVYVIVGEQIIVVACIHSSRHPKQWKRRI